jgi:hypothetical protein
MILTDTFIVERAEIINESRGGKVVPVLKGVFGRCDEKNNNGRVYSKPLLEREVKRIAEAMTERRLLGELDHPSHDSVKLSNVSHLITNLDFNGNELVGECELLDTPSGKVAKALVEGGVKVGISSRGMGTLSEQADGSKHVNEDFKLVTFDLVADPSTRGAFPGISESTQSSLVEEIVSDTLDQAAKEKVFTTLLKDKIREKSAGFATQKPGSMAKGTPDIVKKDKRKPTPEEPFRNWEDLYGAYTGKPRIVKTRGFEDAETVTAPQEVVDHNIYCQLKDVILESQEAPVLSLTYERIAERLTELNEEELNELFGFGGKGSPSIRGRRAHLDRQRAEKGGAIAQRGAQMMKKAAKDTETAKSMPAPEGGLRGAIAGLLHGRALKKARKLDVKGQEIRDKGEGMGPRTVDKATVRARIDTKLADIRKRRGLAQQAQVKRPSTRDARPQQHGVQPNIPGAKPGVKKPTVAAKVSAAQTPVSPEKPTRVRGKENRARRKAAAQTPVSPEKPTRVRGKENRARRNAAAQATDASQTK